MNNNIRIERARCNLTQEKLAEFVGVSRQTINAIESKKYIPSSLLAIKIAKVFGKCMEDIFELEINEWPKMKNL